VAARFQRGPATGPYERPGTYRALRPSISPTGGEEERPISGAQGWLEEVSIMAISTLVCAFVCTFDRDYEAGEHFSGANDRHLAFSVFVR
jgi:hypothetical protein